MPVNSTHLQYDATYPKWKRCRDAYAGSDAIKQSALVAEGEQLGLPLGIDGRMTARGLCNYLPILDGMNAAAYRAYVQRALWYGATKRTVQGLTGAVFRKDAHIVAPQKIEAHLDDVTMDGDVTLPELAKQILVELLVVGRLGLLIEMPATDVAAPDRRPYWVTYAAEQILNWSTRRIGGREMLAMVVIQEDVQIAGEDEFESKAENQWRVLKLDANNLYAVEIWKSVATPDGKGGESQTFVVDQTIKPTNLGKRLNFIPFCFVGPNGLAPDIEDPPLLDLVDVNLSHFRSTADYEHGLHYTALPTPYALGFPASSSLKIGPSTCWVSENPEGKVGMLEFTGQGLKPLADAIKEKELKMAALGARLLETQGRSGVEAAEAIRLRQSGEQGALHSIATTLSQALTKALQWHAFWAGAAGADAHADVNKDFYDEDMPPLLLQSLMAALQSETISYPTFYYNLQKGGIARPGISAEDEQALIAAGTSGVADDTPGNPDGDDS